MGTDKIRYLVFVSGRWRWRPTAAMRRHGFRLTTFGRELMPADVARAITLNREWDRLRRGEEAPARRAWPKGSIGEGYDRAMALRAEERKARNIVQTTEQRSRDDWPRAWKWIAPAIGDFDPQAVTPEIMLALRTRIAASVSESEAFRAIKVWRALWKKMGAMGLCVRDADPSLTFANSAPAPRQAVWHEDEVRRLVKTAWRMGHEGLAAALAVAWDTQLSPVDVRRLTPAQLARETGGDVFRVDRAKTGRAAIGTLGHKASRILRAYLARLDCDLLPSAPIFRTKGKPAAAARTVDAGAADARTARAGRPWIPQPYTKDTLAEDFATVRAAAFGPLERRQLQDFRRSGAVEAVAGGVRPADLSAKMANTLSVSNRLHRTYVPVDVSSVRSVDEARARGRARIRTNKNRPKVS